LQVAADTPLFTIAPASTSVSPASIAIGGSELFTISVAETSQTTSTPSAPTSSNPACATASLSSASLQQTWAETVVVPATASAGCTATIGTSFTSTFPGGGGAEGTSIFVTTP
jgi:hypothetical protein